MRCASDNITQKNALPNALPIISISYKNCAAVRSFSSKEYAVHPIIFLELVRCPSEYFLLYNALLLFSSQACATREMIFFENIAARRFISLKIIYFLTYLLNTVPHSGWTSWDNQYKPFESITLNCIAVVIGSNKSVTSEM